MGDRYRFGFNGQEKVNEIAGVGNFIDYKFRGFDPRVGRFISADPIIIYEKKFPGLTPYQFASNTPIRALDLEGLQAVGWEAQWERNARLAALDGDEEELRNREYKEGIGMGFALLVGLTRGKALTYLNYVTAAGLMEHNRARTPEGRAAQDKRFDDGVKDLAVGFVVGRTATLMAKTLNKVGQVVYKSFNANSIRFSQNSVNDVDEIVESMSKNGWRGDPIDIVKMKDGMYTTVDNTRLLAAKRTGTTARANAHNYDDAIPEDMAVRFANKKGELPKTWGEAVENRVQNQNSQFRNNYPSGSFVEPTAK